MHTKSEGRGVSTDTDVMAETVMPALPPMPSVVTTHTELAAFDIAFRNSLFIGLLALA